MYIAENIDMSMQLHITDNMEISMQLYITDSMEISIQLYITDNMEIIIQLPSSAFIRLVICVLTCFDCVFHLYSAGSCVYKWVMCCVEK